MIPRDVIFGNPDKAAPQMSPDGSRISYLAPVDGVLNLWVAPAGDMAAARPVTFDRGRGISVYFWAYDNQHLLYLQDTDGDENDHVYRVAAESGEVEDLTPIPGIKAQIQGVSHKRPHEILVGLNDRNPQLHDLYLVDLKTGERTRVLQNDGYMSFAADDDYRVRLATAFSPDFSMEILRAKEGDQFEPLFRIPPEDVLTTGIVEFDQTGNSVYLLDSRGRDTAALCRLDLADGQTEVLAKDDRADISGVLIHPTEKSVQAVAVNYQRTGWAILDRSIERDFDILKRVADGDFWVIDRTLDDRIWLVVYTQDNGPVRYYRYDRPSQQATLLFSHRQALEGLPLARMHPVVIRARDGLELISYLTLPVGSDPDGDGRPQQPLPLVLHVHGGPWFRDAWGYDPVHQWLANRGYAVLSVNFRGSTGFGKAFINAANREWGGAMHDDLIDAVEWAGREGIADLARVAISGGSYGGYATLVGLTFTPERFACGVSIVGPSNLITFLQNVPPYWMPFMPLLEDRVGDATTEEGRKFLTERSPLAQVDRICRPLLVGQGANDPRVPRVESDQMVQKVREKGIPVTYLLYPDEGHGFARPANRLSFYAVMEAFLAQHLGGQFEPIGDAFRGASLQVLKGEAAIAGLATALDPASLS